MDARASFGGVVTGAIMDPDRQTAQDTADSEEHTRKLAYNTRIRAIPMHGLYPSEVFGKDRVAPPEGTLVLLKELITLWENVRVANDKQIRVSLHFKQLNAAILTTTPDLYLIHVNPRFGLITVMLGLLHCVVHVVTGSDTHDRAFQHYGRELVILTQDGIMGLNILTRYFSRASLKEVKDLLYLPLTSF